MVWKRCNFTFKIAKKFPIANQGTIHPQLFLIKQIWTIITGKTQIPNFISYLVQKIQTRSTKIQGGLVGFDKIKDKNEFCYDYGY